MNYYNEIRTELINNEIYKKSKDYSKNKSDLVTYYNVGKLLIEAQGGEERAKYGDGLIREYSKRLIYEIDKKYSERNLRNMRKFYLVFKDNINWNAVRSNLSWTHCRELLKLKDINEISYYIDITIKYNLSYRDLSKKIKSKEYDRLDVNTRNKLINKEEEKIEDFIKNPIIIKNSYKDEISEKLLKRLILEDIDNFLKELGTGFCYIENEYKIKLGDRYNYIDLLLYNIKYNCYVVVELKITELKKEHIGQIKAYMNYIDKNVKGINQDKTIGIIICRKDNMFVMEYCSDDRIYRTIYECVGIDDTLC